MKKVLSILLVMVMMVSLIPASAIGVFAADEGITTSDQLTAISGKTGTYVLGADIAVSNLSAPIALANGTTLDGNGHTITIDTLDTTTVRSLFSVNANSTITIQNLKVSTPQDGINVANASSNTYTALLFATVPNNATCTFRNVSLYGSLTVNGGNNVGAFIGKANANATITFEHCTNYLDITANGWTAAYIGAFVKNGASNYITVTATDCANYGDITGKGKAVCALIGDIDDSAAKKTVTVKNFINYGNITGVGHTSGIVADFVGTNAGNQLVVENFANHGNITCETTTAQAMATGICGYTNCTGEIRIQNVLNTGSIMTKSTYNNSCATVTIANGATAAGTNITIENVVNLGAISSDAPSYNSGGHGPIFGYINNGSLTVQNCINVGSYSTKVQSSAFPIGYAKTGGTKTLKNNTSVQTAEQSWGTGDSIEAEVHVSLEKALEILNGESYAGIWGLFKLGDATGEIVLATPVMAGIQRSVAAEDSSFSIRFVATIQDSLSYKEVGFVISAGAEYNQITKNSNQVYTTLTAGQNGQKTYTAEELHGTYIFALSVNEIPANASFVFTVTPYAIDADGTRYDGDSYTITYANGVYQGAEKA